jgi:hypothetical protein
MINQVHYVKKHTLIMAYVSSLALMGVGAFLLSPPVSLLLLGGLVWFDIQMFAHRGLRAKGPK